jgi:hypothetical protein
MSKGFAVHALTAPQKVVVIDEALIRSGITFKPSFTTEDDRIRVVGNQEKALRDDKVLKEGAKIDLDRVQTLLLSFRRIERMENLSSLRSLTKLHLDNNRIQRIENLGGLVHLQWLDLSYNAIEVIEGLEGLQELQCLSLFSNKITAVGGLTGLPKLDTLSLGRNPLEQLDDTVHYLHKLPHLQVLTLKECPLAALPHYRSRVIAFVRKLRFLDGNLIKRDEAAKAREDQRENLLAVDEEDEALSNAAKAKAEQEAVAASYRQYNCPDETKLFDELMHLDPEGRNMEAILRSEVVHPAVKEPLERHQNEFNEQLKQLTASMKDIRERRDADDAAYHQAVDHIIRSGAAKSQTSLQQFEHLLKQSVPKGVGGRPSQLSQSQASGSRNALSPQTVQSLRTAAEKLQQGLLEQEATLYDALEVLHTTTVAKWKADGVEVVLQSAFEALLRLEADFQVQVRHSFDTVFEQRQRSDNANRGLHYGTQDDATLAFLDNKEEYQRTLNEWYELRRKRVEELEMYHLKVEESLLATRASAIRAAEQDRHRQRVHEVMEYIKQATDLIDSHSG